MENNKKSCIKKYWARFLFPLISLLILAGGYWKTTIKAEQRVEDTVQSIADNYDDLNEDFNKLQNSHHSLDKEHTQTRQMVVDIKDDIDIIKKSQEKSEGYIYDLWKERNK